MSTERELKVAHEARLFDIFVLQKLNESERQRKINEMEYIAKSGMTKEEIAEVKARAEEFLGKL